MAVSTPSRISAFFGRSSLSRRPFASSRQRLYRASAALVTATALTVVIVSLSVFMSHRWKPKAASSEQERPFCCPKEAQDSLRYVNRSVQPCKDFFAYVCSAAIKYRPSEDTTVQQKLERIMMTGVVPPGVRTQQGVKFLIAYYRSCLETIRQPSLFLSALACALVGEHQVILKHADRRHALVYSMLASTKYGLPSAIYAFYHSFSGFVELGPIIRCGNGGITLYAVSASVVELNKALNENVSAEAVMKLSWTICKNASIADQRIVTYYAPNQGKELSESVWNIDDLATGLMLLGSSLGNTKFLRVFGAKNLRIINKIWSEDAGSVPSAVKSAYLISHSVLAGYEQFYSFDKTSPPAFFQACNKSVSEMWLLWNKLGAELFTTPDKDAHARATFLSVKKAVLEFANTSQIFETEDNSRLQTFLQNLQIFTPADFSETSDILQPTPYFGKNFLSGRSYQYKSFRKLSMLFGGMQLYQFDVITFYGHRGMFLPAAFYYNLSANESHLNLPNMAILGRLFSDALWFSLLKMNEWTPKTAANIKRLTSCYEPISGDDAGSANEGVTTAIAVLGTLSTLRAFNAPDWLEMKRAWSMWRLSHGMLFYILSASARCPRDSSLQNVRHINDPLMHVKDFAYVFRCSHNAPMRSNRKCLPVERRV